MKLFSAPQQEGSEYISDPHDGSEQKLLSDPRLHDIEVQGRFIKHHTDVAKPSVAPLKVRIAHQVRVNLWYGIGVIPTLRLVHRYTVRV